MDPGGSTPAVFESAARYILPMGRKRGDRDQRKYHAETSEARAGLERRWRDWLELQPRLALLVTGEGAAREPFHRWLRYRQGFSPALVRSFLKENAAPRIQARRPILDPFAGTGTCAVECARVGIPAMGVEALASLAFLARTKSARSFPPMPKLEEEDDWRAAADGLTEPVHRAALMLAVARQYTSSGVRNRGARPLHQLVSECAAMMREDLTQPLNLEVNVIEGDARALDWCADESMGGLLTSPPYLSRHDYTRIAAPYEAVYRHWYSPADLSMACRPWDGRELLASRQIRASHQDRAAAIRSDQAAAPAHLPPNCRAYVDEIADALTQRRAQCPGNTVRAYFQDLHCVVQECFRVLGGGTPCWLVIGGARIDDVYIPTDLILAELAQAVGFAVQDIRVARELVPGARKFGNIGHVAPRESVVILRKR